MPTNRFEKYAQQPAATNRFAKYSTDFTPTEETPTRGVGGLISDSWDSFAGGANILLKMGGDLYGLTTGDMDNWASEQGQRGVDYWNTRKSDYLKGLEQNRKAKVDAADGQLAKAGTALWQTIKSPSLISSFMFEQVPMLLPIAGAGRTAGVAAQAAGLGAKGTVRAATAGAVGTGAAMQGSDAGSQAYDQLIALPDPVWAMNEDYQAMLAEGMDPERAKQSLAVDLSRNAAIASGIASVGLNLLPGARILEKSLAGVKLPGNSRAKNAIKGFFGEAFQEGAEEGSGAFLANRATAAVDPSQDLMEGVGEATGLGAAFGPFGAVAGALNSSGAGEKDIDGLIDDVLDPEVSVDDSLAAAEEMLGATDINAMQDEMLDDAADVYQYMPGYAQFERDLGLDLEAEANYDSLTPEAGQDLAIDYDVPTLDAELETEFEAERRTGRYADGIDFEPGLGQPATDNELSTEPVDRLGEFTDDGIDFETPQVVLDRLAGAVEAEEARYQSQLQEELTQETFRQEEERIKSQGDWRELKSSLIMRGGLDLEQMQAEGILDGKVPKGMTRLFKRNGGMSIDAALEALNQNGDWNFADKNELIDALTDTVQGRRDVYGTVGTDLRSLYESKAYEESQYQQYEDGEWTLEQQEDVYHPESTVYERILADEAQKAIDAGMSPEQARAIIDQHAAQNDDWGAMWYFRGYAYEQNQESQPEGQGVQSGQGEGQSEPDSEIPWSEEGLTGQDAEAALGGSLSNKPDFSLESPTEQSLKDQEAAQAATSAQAAAEEQKADADEQLGDFTLSGSDSAVDQAEARGQSNLFDQAANEAATSPDNSLPEPTEAQKEASPTLKTRRSEFHARRLEPVIDRILTDSDLLGDSANAQTFAVHGFDSVDRDTQHMVLSEVIGLLDDRQIVNSIVKSVPINVMNMLFGKEVSPDMLLHDESVLREGLSVSRDEPVPQSVVEVIDSLISSVEGISAPSVTEKSSLLSMRVNSSEAGSTVRTKSERGDDTGSTAEDSLAGSGPPVPAEGVTTGVTSEREGHVTTEVNGKEIEVNVNPTDAQKEAGSYKKGHVSIRGLAVTIENPKGTIRTGTDADGNKWEVELSNHYGYIKRTEGADGEHVDVFIGKNPLSKKVFVVDQVNQDGSFDEHKVILGENSVESATEAYKSNYQDGFKVGPVTEMSIDEFKDWVANGDTTSALTAVEPDTNTAEAQKGVAETEPKAEVVDEADLAERTKANVAGETPDRALLIALRDILEDGTDSMNDGWIPPAMNESALGLISSIESAISGNTDIPAVMRDAQTTIEDWQSEGYLADNSDTFAALEKRLQEQLAIAAPDNKTLEAVTDTPENPSTDTETKASSPAESAMLEAAAAMKEAAEAIKSQVAVSSQPEKPIEDFGEKIGGARKDIWGAYKDIAEKAEEVDPADVPLSKSWPEPDYQKMLEDGADPWAVGFMRSARDEVPNKPRQSYKLKRWTEQVTMLRDVAMGLVNGKYSTETARELANKSRSALGAVVDRVELYMAVGHEKSLKGVRLVNGSYSMYKGVEYSPAKTIWTVNKKAKATSFSNWPSILAEGDTKEEAIEQFREKYDSLELSKPASKEVKFTIYSKRDEDGYFIGKKLGRNYVDLEKFDDLKDARKYLSENNEALVSKLEERRKIPEVRRDKNNPRVGEDMRGGEDVTPEIFAETFGFRGVEFGNWVEGAKRQQDLNDAFDALMDMSAILDIPPKAISLNGELGLAFGARGAGGIDPAKAHYEPGYVVINLTKKDGAGSLGHEWWHALDNYFSRSRAKGGEYMTTSSDVSLSAIDRKYYHEGPVRKEMIDAFGAVMKAIKATALKARSQKLDDKRGKPYWTTGEEMSARAFESYLISKIQDQNASNDYLANIVSDETWKAAESLGFELEDSYPYPTAGEIPGIRAAFDSFFDTVETKETEKGVALFHSNTKKVTKGIGASKVREAIIDTVLGWQSGPTINVVENSSELPAGLKREVESFDGEVSGLIDPQSGHIYLIGNNIRSAEHAQTVLAHEAVGHYAFEREYGDQLESIYNKVDFLASKDADVRKIAEEVERTYRGRSEVDRKSEIVARLAEQDIKHPVFMRLYSKIRQWLRDIGFSIKFSKADLQGMIAQASRSLQRKHKVDDAPNRIVRFSAQEDGLSPEAEKFINGALDGSVNPRETFELESTPAVYVALGAQDIPLRLLGSAIRKAAKKHKLSAETIKSAITNLHDPVMVFDSATEDGALVALTDTFDESGRPIVAAIHLEKKGMGYEVNDVASVHGKESAGAIKNWIEKGLLAYRNRQKSRSWLRSAPLQLRWEGAKNGRRGRILLEKDVVNRDTVRFSAEASYTPAESGFGIPEETLTSVAVRKIQDKFKVLKDLQTNIRESGGTIDEQSDAYIAEELFHGKAENDIRIMRESLIEPLADKMAKSGINSAELDKYLYAKHAPERNAHIAEINPEMPAGGSGMTDAEATRILADVRKSGMQAKYDELAQSVYDMLQKKREVIRDSGLEEEGLLDAWEEKYDYYVPLKGWADDTKDQGIPGSGKGYSISGKESKQALGRSSEAASPLSYSIMDMTNTLIRKRKNEVGNAFLKLVENNPNPDYWNVYTDENPDQDRRVVDGEVKVMPIPMAMMTDRYFTTKRNGKTHYIKLEDERLMKAMKNIGPESNGALIRTLAGINRVLSSLNTSYSPEFMTSNFARDIQTALLNLQAEQSLPGGKAAGKEIAQKTAKNVPVAMKAIYASLSGRKLKGRGAEWQNHFEQFRADGAKTGWFDMKDLDGQAKELDTLVQMAAGGVKGNAMKFMKSSSRVVENLNSSVENAVRLSAYVNAIRAGIPRTQAASLAKNMTVNFNRRGEIGSTINALYMFANASIQGVANFGRTMVTLKDPKAGLKWSNLNNAQKIAVGLVAGSYFLALANRASAGDDDDGENWYDKVPDYVKERNLVIMKSLFGGPQDGTYWRIPLPYGYNVFYVLGNGMESVFNGGNSPMEASSDLALAVLGSFSPIGFQDSETIQGLLLKNAAPTVVKPVVEIGLNENFMASSIYNENFPFGVQKPDSSLGRRSTSAAYKNVAEWLNKTTGGSEFRPGAIDVNPDVMQYIVGYFGGSAYSFFGDKLPDYAYRKATGVEVQPHRVPFLSRLTGKVLPYDDVDKFYKRRDEIGQVEAEYKSLPIGERAEFAQEFRGTLRLRGLMRQTEKRMQALRKRRDIIYGRDLSPAERDDQLQGIEAQMKSAIDRFNAAYAESRP